MASANLHRLFSLPLLRGDAFGTSQRKRCRLSLMNRNGMLMAAWLGSWRYYGWMVREPGDILHLSSNRTSHVNIWKSRCFNLVASYRKFPYRGSRVCAMTILRTWDREVFMNVFMFKHLSRFVIAIASFLETVLWKFIYKDVIVNQPYLGISSRPKKQSCFSTSFSIMFRN